MRAGCYDDVPEKPWSHRAKLQKHALPDDVCSKRLQWAQKIAEDVAMNSGWCYRNVVWTDL